MRFLTLICALFIYSCVASQLREQKLDCRSQSESACAVDDPEYDYLNKIPELPPAGSNFDKPPVFPESPARPNPKDLDKDPDVDDDGEEDPPVDPAPPDSVPPITWKCSDSLFQGKQVWTCDKQRRDVYRCSATGQTEYQKCDEKGCRVSALGCDDVCASAPVQACP
ncbi:MAG: hypothetical protein KBD78_16600 [Oligoflexales bacterium]|nr:hypothetical protein [Oligoflexales bacterium]